MLPIVVNQEIYSGCNEERLINADNINYCHNHMNGCKVHFNNGDETIIDCSIKELEKIIDTKKNSPIKTVSWAIMKLKETYEQKNKS